MFTEKKRNGNEIERERVGGAWTGRKGRAIERERKRWNEGERGRERMRESESERETR